jgi:SsrA-binding protein
MAKAKKAAKSVGGRTIVAQNRRARHDYDILDVFEAGLVLIGSEVKSLREGKLQLKDSYARIEQGEAWLFGVHIPPYIHAAGFGAHEPERKRKLLLHHREIEELKARSQQESLTIVPLSVYFDKGRAKVEIALARGRHTYDKRRALAERDAKREADRALRGRE